MNKFSNSPVQTVAVTYTASVAVNKALTMTDLGGPLLKNRHLVFGLRQLFLQGILSLPGTYIHSRLRSQIQIPTECEESTRGDLSNFPSTTASRSAAASFAIYSATSSFFFKATTSFSA
jgi:hypothetical protein